MSDFFRATKRRVKGLEFRNIKMANLQEETQKVTGSLDLGKIRKRFKR